MKKVFTILLFISIVGCKKEVLQKEKTLPQEEFHPLADGGAATMLGIFKGNCKLPATIYIYNEQVSGELPVYIMNTDPQITLYLGQSTSRNSIGVIHYVTGQDTGKIVGRDFIETFYINEY